MSYQVMEGRRWGIKYTLRDQAGNTKQKGEKTPMYLMISTTWHSGAGTRERKNESGQTRYDTDAPGRHFSNRKMTVTKLQVCDFFFLKHV